MKSLNIQFDKIDPKESVWLLKTESIEMPKYNEELVTNANYAAKRGPESGPEQQAITPPVRSLASEPMLPKKNRQVNFNFEEDNEKMNLKDNIKEESSEYAERFHVQEDIKTAKTEF